jgi:GH15 family glucan-1,4-alpha-glucosidase
VYGGLKAARNFAVCFGDRVRADRYHKAAEEIKAGAAKFLYSEKLGRFVRRLVPRDQPTPPLDGDTRKRITSPATSTTSRSMRWTRSSTRRCTRSTSSTSSKPTTSA